MPFDAEFKISRDTEIAIDGDDVNLSVPTGNKVIRLSTSRHRARDFACRLLNALNNADRDQTARVLPFKTVDEADGAH